MMTVEEKAAAFDRLADKLLVPADLVSEKVVCAALDQLVDERCDARSMEATLGLELVRAEREVKHSHNMLGLIYNDLIVLETTLKQEQLLFCPVNWCKYWKFPEWQEKREWYSSDEGRADLKETRLARAEQLLEWMKAQGRRTEHLQVLMDSMSTWKDEDDGDDSWKEEWRREENDDDAARSDRVHGPGDDGASESGADRRSGDGDL